MFGAAKRVVYANLFFLHVSNNKDPVVCVNMNWKENFVKLEEAGTGEISGPRLN